MELPAGVDGAVSYRVQFVRRYAITVFNCDLLGGTVDGVPLALAGGGLASLSASQLAATSDCAVASQGAAVTKSAALLNFNCAVVGQGHTAGDGQCFTVFDGKRLAVGNCCVLFQLRTAVNLALIPLKNYAAPIVLVRLV